MPPDPRVLPPPPPRLPGFEAGGSSAAPETVRRMFTRIAPRYDLANRALSLGLDTFWRRATARALVPAPGARVLDLACGTGDLTRDLARRGAEVIGADFTFDMLARGAGKRTRDRRMAFVCADALALPFADASFDAVAVAFGVRNFASLPEALAEIARTLRPGGRLGILEFCWPRGFLGAPARFYLRRVIPALGRLISGADGPYTYLFDTIRAWPPPEDLARSIEGEGFAEVRWRRLAGGVATLHLARRPGGYRR